MKKIRKFNSDFEKAPKSFDVNANFRIKTKGGGFIKYYGGYDSSSMRLAMQGLEAVSYTHLDVYKRQKLGRRNLCRKN